MPTRRAIVLGTIATGIAVRTGRALAKASQPATPVNSSMIRARLPKTTKSIPQEQIV